MCQQIYIMVFLCTKKGKCPTYVHYRTVKGYSYHAILSGDLVRAALLTTTSTFLILTFSIPQTSSINIVKSYKGSSLPKLRIKHQYLDLLIYFKNSNSIPRSTCAPPTILGMSVTIKSIIYINNS